MTGLSRRSLLKLAGSSLAVQQGAFSYAAVAAAPTGLLLNPARYADVTVLDGPMRDQFRTHHAALLAMDEDALLKPFREAAGLPAPGEALGGWYNRFPGFNPPADMHGFIPGHSFGQYVSSLSRAYALSGDTRTKEKVQRLVAGFALTVGEGIYR